MSSRSLSHATQGEKLKHTMKRLQGRVRIVINESSYETALADVKTANSNLSGLREQITALQDIARPKPKERPTPPNTQWMSVCKVRRASKALHHAFSDVWSHAKDSNHLQHVVKMFLEADVKGTMMQPEIHLNLAIVCSASPTCPRTGTLLPLLVKCQQHDELLEIKRPWTPPDSFRPSPPNKRVKIVRFAEEQILRDAYPLESGRNENTQRYGNAETGNLRLSKQVCTDLANAGPSTQNKHGEDCLGYIDVQSDKTFRHLFYPQTSRPWNSQQSHLDLVDPGDVMAMSDLLSPSASRLLTPIEKLRLALRLVKTVLNFHATPWMQDVWRLGDFLFFRQGDDVPAWLQTLHLGIEFTSTTTPRVDNDTSYMEGVLPTPPSERSRGDSDTPLLSSMSEDSRLLCGIDNFQLHCLGVALLQIDHWIQLEPEDVVGVRRLARQPSSLTPRFPSMIQKCLRCDFGCGYNLEQPRLQRAVYEGLVGPLEDMISKLDLGPESDFE
jgi:hypothetical protein